MKILVISDIHGNAEALRAVLAAESDADCSLFLGDALLSGPQANETMALLDELAPDIAIMGNHDDEVLDPSIFAAWPVEWVALNEWIIERLDASSIRLSLRAALTSRALNSMRSNGRSIRRETSSA